MIHKIARNLPYFVITLVLFTIMYNIWFMEHEKLTLLVKAIFLSLFFLGWIGMLIGIYFRNCQRIKENYRRRKN